MKREDEYLSDEDLLQFIAEVEEEPLLEAPSYLKDRILLQAREDNILINKKQKHLAKKQFIGYGCKVALASAAAVAVLFTAPMNLKMTSQNVEQYRQESISYKITDKSNQICDKFERITNLLIGKEELSNEKAEEK